MVMMTEAISERVADLRATIDYLTDLTERADSFDFDEATDLRDEAQRVQAVAKKLAEMLEGQMVKQLEAGSRERGGRVWARVRKYVERHDHSVIAKRVREQAIAAYLQPDTGEVNAELAVAEAVRAMQELYVSPSTKANLKPAKTLGLDKSQFARDEFQKYGLGITELDPGRS